MQLLTVVLTFLSKQTCKMSDRAVDGMGRQGQGTDHVLLACHKVNTPPTQFSPIVGIMPPAIYASVAYVVNRSGIGSATEAALEFAAPVHKVHVGVHVRLALRAPNRARLPKVNCLHSKG